ncbi:MAG: type IV secretory system conjugative DNA transfer family protein [Bryobacteraceae bacterium]|nr:type IV secretory system conjugative DNA transfer family protein [Bryobacteraceae bacterium]
MSTTLKLSIQLAIQLLLAAAGSWCLKQLMDDETDWWPWLKYFSILGAFLFATQVLWQVDPAEKLDWGQAIRRIGSRWFAILQRSAQYLTLVLVVVLVFHKPAEWVPRWYQYCAAVVLIALLIWDHALRRSRGFRLFPRGYGAILPFHQQGQGEFLPLFDLATGFGRAPGGIFMGRSVAEHSILGLAPRVQVGPKDEKHMLTIAGARSGKGSAAVIPNLLTYPGSVLVVDPKGELAQITAARRGHGSQRVTEYLGQDVFIIDPEDIVVGHDRQKASWNPLGELDPTDPDVWGKVNDLATAMIPMTTGDSAFFMTHARNFLTAVMAHVLIEEPEKANLIYVRKLVTQGDTEMLACLEEEFEEWPETQAKPYDDAFDALILGMTQSPHLAGNISRVAERLIGLAPETRSSVLGFLDEQTSFLDRHSMAKTLVRQDFSLGDLKLRPTTIYVCLTGSSLAGPLSKFIALMIIAATHKMEQIRLLPEHRVLFIIDEFYCLGRLESIDRAMPLMPGYGLTLWPILQGLDQLQAHYPATWNNFIGNCRAIQLFGEQNPEHIRTIANTLGKRATKGKNASTSQEDLLSYNYLKTGFFRRDNELQLVLFEQESGIPLQLVHYWKWKNRRIFPTRWYEKDPRSGLRQAYMNPSPQSVNVQRVRTKVV